MMLALNRFLVFAFIMYVNSVKPDNHEKAAPAAAPAAVHERSFSGYGCSMDGQWCLFDSNCCSTRCGWDFHCKNLYEDFGACVPHYGRCIDNNQCCSGECYGGYICIPWASYYRNSKPGLRALSGAGEGADLNARAHQPAPE